MTIGRDFEVKSIDQLTDIGACHAVMMELRPHLTDADSFIRQVMRQHEHGFRLSAAWCDGRIVGPLVVAFRDVDDLVVHNEYRNDGIGAKLLSVARAYALELSCRHFVLDTGLHKALAQRFYFRQGLLAHAMGFSETLFDPDSRVPADDVSAVQLAY